VLGDEVQLLDGKGGLYRAVIQEAHPKKCEMRIVESVLQYGCRPYNIHIALAPTKNIDRTEWFLEKATEIGIDSISFLWCERSERKQVSLERLDKVLISAMKQSVKAFKPELREMISFKEFIQAQPPMPMYIAHLEAHNRIPLHQIAPAPTTCVLIGPEGDFSPAEIEMAYAYGVKPVTLGTSRLRTETAALVACHTLNLLHEMKSA
jgi:16S rRNA (uracil1498-N3)-methyltransferase